MLLAACGGGGGGSGGSGTQQGTDIDASPAFPGFAPELAAGDFWVYGWTGEDVDGSGGGTSVYNARGTFAVTLGASVMISGREAFPLEITGNPTDNELDRRFDVTPRWTHVAVDGGDLLATRDGATWITIFDADLGAWAGGGFFASFPDDALVVATDGSIDNEFVSQPAIVAERSASEQQCESIAGELICGDAAIDLLVQEFYAADVGVIGYYFDNDGLFTGGGFGSLFNIERNLGLIASSLRGDALDFRLEREPNNDPAAEAMPLASGEIVRAALNDEDSHGGTAPLVTEVEPNDTAGTPQLDPRPLPYVMTGTVAPGDAATSFTGTVNSVTFSGSSAASIEDFYEFTVASACTARVSHFDGEGGNSDVGNVDLFLFQGTGSGAAAIDGDFGKAPIGVNRGNLIDIALSVGDYMVGVDVRSIPETITYNLSISCGTGFPPEAIEPADWYAVELVAPGAISAVLEGVEDLVLTGADGRPVIAYGTRAGDQATIASGTLPAGSYRVGVYDDRPGDTEYDLEITYGATP